MKEQTICSFAATEAALAANNVTDADSKGVQTVAQATQASLRNHTGGGVQQVGEGVPAKWRLKEAANWRRLASKAEFNGIGGFQISPRFK
jgi:hypothetical protein